VEEVTREEYFNRLYDEIRKDGDFPINKMNYIPESAIEKFKDIGHEWKEQMIEDIESP
jgi:hypothetical protein